LENGFFAAGRVTAADIVFWDALDQIKEFSPKLEKDINDFTNIKKWSKRIKELPNINKYLRERQ